MSIIKQLIYKKTYQDGRQPVAFCCFFDGIFDSELASLGIKLIGVKEFSKYPLSNLLHPNIQLISINEIHNYNYDLIIFNDLIKQKEHINQLPRSLHVPGIIVNHEPTNETGFHLKQRLREAKLEYITTIPSIPNSIPYGITQQQPYLNKDIPVLLAGIFNQSHTNLLNQFKREIPQLQTLSNYYKSDYNITPTDYQDYQSCFARCKIYIRIPTKQQIDYELLWAIVNGAYVISLNDPIAESLAIPYNIDIAHSIPDLINKIKHALTKQSLPTSDINLLSEQFSYNNFQQQWTHIIQQYCKKVYINE